MLRLSIPHAQWVATVLHLHKQKWPAKKAGAFVVLVEMGGIEPPCNEVLLELLRSVDHFSFLKL